MSSATRLAAQCVALSTLPDESAQTERKLIEFLASPSTCDLVYKLLLARAADAPATVAMVTKIVATHITACTPSPKVLQQLFAFFSARDDAPVLVAVLRTELRRVGLHPTAPAPLSVAPPVAMATGKSAKGNKSVAVVAVASNAAVVPASSASSVSLATASTSDAFLGNVLRARPRPRTAAALATDAALPNSLISFLPRPGALVSTPTPSVGVFNLASFSRAAVADHSAAAPGAASSSSRAPVANAWFRGSAPVAVAPTTPCRVVSFGGVDDDLVANDEHAAATAAASAASAASSLASLSSLAPTTTFATLPSDFASSPAASGERCRSDGAAPRRTAAARLRCD
jgi:hypothetical protein